MFQRVGADADRRKIWSMFAGAGMWLILAGAAGFEPATTGFGDQRSGQTELRSCVVPLEGLEPPTRDLGRRRSIL